MAANLDGPGPRSDATDEAPPSRTLFVRNIAFSVTEEEVKSLFSRYGEVRRIFNLIQKRGMAFVTFVSIYS